jgi:Domain of unknown function (DUF4203)
MQDLWLIVTALFSIAFGIIDCFFGYRIFRIILSIIGFIVGASIAMSLVAADTQLVTILAAIVGGIIGAILMNVLYFLGVIISGALLGALLANLLLTAVGVEPNAIILVIGAILGGAAALAMNKLMIILSTAFSGAAAIVYGVSLFIPNLGGFDPLSALRRGTAPQSEPSLLLFVVWIILGIVGFGFQYRAYQQDEIEQQSNTVVS